MEQEIESTRNFKAGYQIHHGRWRNGEGDDWTPMKWATTPTGDYIGDPKDAYHLCHTRGIAPELRTGNSNTCSIGFSKHDERWYGWSHRAICGFGVGDVVSEGDCTASSGWIDGITPEGDPDTTDVLPVGFTAKTLEDAKLMAKAFASSVS